MSDLKNAVGWQDRAACRNMDTEEFFNDVRSQRAKKICRQCPVITECLNFAMKCETRCLAYRHGIYGGLTPGQREQLAHRRATGGRQDGRALATESLPAVRG